MYMSAHDGPTNRHVQAWSFWLSPCSAWSHLIGKVVWLVSMVVSHMHLAAYFPRHSVCVSSWTPFCSCVDCNDGCVFEKNNIKHCHVHMVCPCP